MIYFPHQIIGIPPSSVTFLLKPYYSRSSVFGTADTDDLITAVSLATATETPSASTYLEAAISGEDMVLWPRLRNSKKLAELDTLFGHLPDEGESEIKSCCLILPSCFQIRCHVLI